MDTMLSSLFTTTSNTFTAEIFESVAYNPSLLYSTLIIAILLTKGYGRNIALAVGRKMLHEPSKKIWRAVRAIKPRQIMYYGLRWGIPLHQLRDLLLLHRAVLRNRPRVAHQRSHKNVKKQTLRARSLNSTVNLYRKMPLKAVSRAWGKMTSMDLPVSLRQPLLGLYVWMFDVKLHEANDDNLKNYKNLSEFFRRQLKPNIREISVQSPITSPADGKILHFGKVENGVVEQVKGVNYAIKGFLGPHPSKTAGSESETSTLQDGEYQKTMNIKQGHSLYHCIIYLAPGDYHRFHSPTDWCIAHRRHFPGELLSVNPGVARWVQGLFSFNERAVYSGTWKYGYFSYTAVGATNVGSIKFYLDQDLETNAHKSYPENSYFDKSFEDNGSSVHVAKGDMLGEFNLGSTIVLMFEAPNNYKFCVKPGEKVKYGESLGGMKMKK